MKIVANRRGFLVGLGATLFAAPAIVRASSLMVLHGEPLLTVHMRILTEYTIARLDVLYGAFTDRPEWEPLGNDASANWLKATQAEFDAVVAQYPHDVRHAQQIARHCKGEQCTMRLMTFPENLDDSPMYDGRNRLGPTRPANDKLGYGRLPRGIYERETEMGIIDMMQASGRS